eukprot:Skav228227  [mRNA]  locus=scaffold3932:42446:63049:+ [translate_table: standard]
MSSPQATPVESAPPRRLCSRASRMTTKWDLGRISCKAMHAVCKARVKGEVYTTSGLKSFESHCASASGCD